MKDCLENIQFSNSGFLELKNTKTFFKNACSTDYFLLIIYVCVEFGTKIEERAKSGHLIYKSFVDIHSLLKKNDWNKARFVWVNENHNKFTTSGLNTFYDLFLSLNEAFLNTTKEYQKFSCFGSCEDPKCSVNGREFKISSMDFFLR